MRAHHLAAIAALLLLASPGAAEEPPRAPAPPATPAAPAEGAATTGTLAILDGVVRALDLARHQVTIEVNGDPVILGLDRNTLVYLPSGLSTVSSLRPGDLVRAGRSASSVAFWIQVRSARGAGSTDSTPSTPGQGTGPGGGAGAPPETPAPAVTPGTSR